MAMKMWVIRGTDPRSGQDFALVVESRSATSAECWALKRGVPAEFIGEAESSDIAEARRTKQLWRVTPESRYTCLGQPVPTRQVVALMLFGVMTAGLVFVRTSHSTKDPLRATKSTIVRLTAAWT